MVFVQLLCVFPFPLCPISSWHNAVTTAFIASVVAANSVESIGLQQPRTAARRRQIQGRDHAGKGLRRDPPAKASDFDNRQQLRAEEMETLEKTIEIIGSRFGLSRGFYDEKNTTFDKVGLVQTAQNPLSMTSFKDYSKNKQAGGVQGMIQTIIDDAKAMENEAIVAEEDAQKGCKNLSRTATPRSRTRPRKLSRRPRRRPRPTRISCKNWLASPRPTASCTPAAISS